MQSRLHAKGFPFLGRESGHALNCRHRHCVRTLLAFCFGSFYEQPPLPYIQRYRNPTHKPELAIVMIIASSLFCVFTSGRKLLLLRLVSLSSFCYRHAYDQTTSSRDHGSPPKLSSLEHHDHELILRTGENSAGGHVLLRAQHISNF